MSNPTNINIQKYSYQPSASNISRIRNQNTAFQNGDIYSEKDFNLVLYSYPTDDPACQKDSNAAGCPRVNIAQEAINAANIHTALLANNIFTVINKISSSNNNPDLGEVELSVGVAASPAGIVPSGGISYKRTWKIAANRRLFYRFG